MKRVIFISVLILLGAWFALTLGPKGKRGLIVLAAAPAPSAESVAERTLRYAECPVLIVKK